MTEARLLTVTGLHRFKTQSGADRWEPPACGGTSGIHIRSRHQTKCFCFQPKCAQEQL